MAQPEISPLSKKITILVGLGVVSAMAFGLAISFYRNILFEETLNTLSNRNRQIRQNIDDGIGLLAYYRSRQYRDKYAKENLGKLNTGEKILIITEDDSILPMDDISIDQPSRTEKREASYFEYLQKLPTIQHWRLYLLEHEKLSLLKQSF